MVSTLFVGLMLIAGIILSLIISCLYSIYFKYGYSKGKTLASIPFLLIGILFVIWVITLMVSYKLSNRFYSKRDF